MHVSAESELDPRDERSLQQSELIEQQAAQIRMLECEIVRLKELLEKKAAAKTAKTPNFSLDRNKRNKQRKNTNRSTSKRGRKKQQAKLNRVTQEQEVFPEGVDPKKCELRRTQFVWRWRCKF